MPQARILIADSDDNLRSMLCAVLRHHDYKVTDTGTQESLLQELAKGTTDLVLLGTPLTPDGQAEFYRILRSPTHETRVLTITSSEAGDADRGQGHPSRTLLKPFSIHDLVNQVAATLDIDTTNSQR